MKKNIFLIAVFLLLVGCGKIKEPIEQTVDTVNGVLEVHAKSEARWIISRIEDFCSAENVYIQLDPTYDSKCTDGEKILSNINAIVNISDYQILNLKYNKRVTDLTIVVNGVTVVYDGSSYTISK